MNERTPARASHRFCIRIGLASALLLPAVASALAEDSCSLRVSASILRPQAYPRQTLDQRSKHTSIETVSPHAGLRVEMRQDACEDFITTRFTLIVAHGREHKRTDQEWIDFARAEIAGLKTREPQRFKDLEAFLARAYRVAPRKGVRAICRDGSAADAGECSWDSLGGYTISIAHVRNVTTISVTEYVSA